MWASGTGAGTVVAVVDSGVDPTADLPAARILGGRDFTGQGSGTGDLRPSLHGTRSAEAAAGTGNNGIGNAGGCWDCAVLPVRVLGATGGAFSSHTAAVITWAVDQGADVVTFSLSGDTPSLLAQQAVRYAADRGVVVVASAGNTGTEQVRYPAGYDEVIGVAGLSAPEAAELASTLGPHVDLAAPSCTPLTVTVAGSRLYCGTSSATRRVAGHLASLISAGFEPRQVGDAVVATARDMAFVGGGQLDAAAALAGLTAGDFPAPPPLEQVPEPEPEPEPEPVAVGRLAGRQRFATAAVIAASTHPDGAEEVIVVSATTFPDALADALAGGPAAARVTRPLLLTDGPASIGAATEQTVAARAGSIAHLTVLGGPAAVPRWQTQRLAQLAGRH